tara:strand:+ start:3798 stop:5009 length:1212 start_codon:yes stop_codon:yes gene_type:complete
LKRKLKALVVFGSIPLFGAEKGNLEALRELSQHGIEPVFLTNKKYGHLFIETELDRLGFRYHKAAFGPRIQKGLSLWGIYLLFWGMFATSFALWRACRKEKPDFLYLMNPLYAFYVWPALKLLRQPAVYRLGDEPAVHNFLYRWLWGSLQRRLKKVVVISDFIGRSAEACGFKPAQIRRIYNVAPDSLGNGEAKSGELRLTLRKIVGDQPSDHQETFHREDGVFHLLYIGQIAEHKGVQLAVDACLKLAREGRKLRLLIAGDPRSGLAVSIAKQIAEKKAEDVVRILGFVRNAKDLWQVVDLHLFPSIWEEPLGNSVVEAKAAGIPSVIFKRGGTQELVKDGVDGRNLTDESSEALAGAIEGYMDDPDLVRAHGRAAKESAENEFSRARFVKAWLETIDEVMA